MKRVSLPLLLMSVLACGDEPSSEKSDADAKPPAEQPATEPTPPPEPEISPLEAAQAKCKTEAACTAQGLCTAKAGAEPDKFDCVASSDDDCRASSKCKTEAACTLDAATGACAFLSGKDCWHSDLCFRDGRCFGKDKDDGRECVATKEVVDQHFGDRLEYQGALDEDILRRLLRAHNHHLKMCRVKARASGDNVNGLAKIGWTITAEGKSADVKIVADGLETPVFANCLVEQITGWEFVKPEDGKPTTLVMGFSFAK
jgi:hypothetical protein